MMTLQQYLQGKFKYEFAKENFDAAYIEIVDVDGILTTDGQDNAPLTVDSDVLYFTEKGRDLMRAALYDVLSTVIGGGGRREQRDGMSITEGSVSFGITDREQFHKEAAALRAKWNVAGEEDLSFVVSRSF